MHAWYRGGNTALHSLVRTPGDGDLSICNSITHLRGRMLVYFSLVDDQALLSYDCHVTISIMNIKQIHFEQIYTHILCTIIISVPNLDFYQELMNGKATHKLLFLR